MRNKLEDWKAVNSCYACRDYLCHGAGSPAAATAGSVRIRHPAPAACAAGRKAIERDFDKQLQGRGWKKVTFSLWTDMGEVGAHGKCAICGTSIGKKDNPIIHLSAIGR